ncbi:MAG: CBS domain-containing protein [Alphaproteobacteria bacterium]
MLVASILKAKGHAVTSAPPETTVAQAVEILKRERIGVIVVVDTGGALAGILSERDIVHALASAGTDFLQHPISEFMTAAVVCCTPSQTLEDLMREMTNRRIRHLPVLEEGRLTGIISIGDVVKYRLGELQAERDALQEYIATG